MILLIISCWIFQIPSSNAPGIREQHIRQIWHVRSCLRLLFCFCLCQHVQSQHQGLTQRSTNWQDLNIYGFITFFSIIWWVMCYCILYILLVTLYVLLSLIHIAPSILHLSTDYLERRGESFRWISVFKDTLYILLLPLRIWYLISSNRDHIEVMNHTTSETISQDGKIVEVCDAAHISVGNMVDWPSFASPVILCSS